MTSTFKEAAKLIKRRGWVQGANRGPKGEYDLCTAIAAVAEPGEFMDAYDLLQQRIGKPDAWNDNKRRTKEEVLALLNSLT